MALWSLLTILFLAVFRPTKSLELTYQTYLRSTQYTSQFDVLANASGVDNLFDCMTFSYSILMGSVCGAFKFDKKVGGCSAGTWRPNELQTGLEILLYTGGGECGQNPFEMIDKMGPEVTSK